MFIILFSVVVVGIALVLALVVLVVGVIFVPVVSVFEAVVVLEMDQGLDLGLEA